MRKMKIIFIFWISLSCKEIKAQYSSLMISNDSIKYTFDRVGQKQINKKYYVSSKYVFAINLSDSEYVLLKKTKKNQWLNLLNDKKFDWAANILLYYLYKRDAVQYKYVITKRDYWLLMKQKQKEIRYWKKYLKYQCK